MAFQNFFLNQLQELEQTTTVDEFYQQFDGIKSLVEYKEPGISELYYASLFINGLRTEVHANVEGFLPVTVFDAYCLASLFVNGYSRTIRQKKQVEVAHVAEEPIPDPVVKVAMVDNTDVEGNTLHVAESIFVNDDDGTVSNDSGETCVINISNFIGKDNVEKGGSPFDDPVDTTMVPTDEIVVPVVERLPTSGKLIHVVCLELKGFFTKVPTIFSFSANLASTTGVTHDNLKECVHSSFTAMLSLYMDTTTTIKDKGGTGFLL